MIGNTFRKFFRKLLIQEIVNIGTIHRTPTFLHSDIDSFADRGYANNVFVFSAINMIATRMSSIPWSLYRVKDKQKFRRTMLYERKERLNPNWRKERDSVLERIDGHRINEILQKPNGLMSWSEYVTAVVSWKLLSGNTFTLGIGPDTGENQNKFFNLIPYPSYNVTILARSYPEPITGYQLRTRTEAIPPNVVMHLKTFDPRRQSDFRIGMSPIEAAIEQVTQVNSYSEWNTTIVQNLGLIPGILKVKVKHLDKEQADDIRSQFGKDTSGENRGKPFVTDESSEFTPTAYLPKDMEWLQGLKLNGRLIAVAFDIPPQLLGDDSTSTYNNVESALRNLYMGRIIPEMDALRDGLNPFLVKPWDESLFLDYDLEAIEILQEERTAVHQRAREDWKAGLITLNEARQEIGRDDIGEEGNFRVLPLGFAPDNGGDPFAGDDDLDEDEKHKTAIELLKREGALDFSGNGS